MQYDVKPDKEITKDRDTTLDKVVIVVVVFILENRYKV